MKDKKAGQIKLKSKHWEQLKNNRRNEPMLERGEPFLAEKPTILIVCEGEVTEPSYFKQFRLSSATIKAMGEGYNTISLVNRAFQLATQASYDQVWCVFDKDDFPDVDFNNAISKAEANKCEVAYSNQAFEYWIILHFTDHQGGGMHRTQYCTKINSLLKPFRLSFDCDKKEITEEIFELLEGYDEKTKKERKISAIERAKRNYKNGDNSNPAKNESSTSVFKLVEELLKYI
jgi:hypothetical protein